MPSKKKGRYDTKYGPKATTQERDRWGSGDTYRKPRKVSRSKTPPKAVGKKPSPSQGKGGFMWGDGVTRREG